MIFLRLLCLSTLGLLAVDGAIPDRPFLQDVAVRIHLAPELTNAALLKLCLDRDSVAYVLTDRGVARVFGDTLALDRSFRPLTAKLARDIALSPDGQLYYLFDDRWLSNGDSGRPLGHFRPGTFERLAVAADGTVLLSGTHQ